MPNILRSFFVAPLMALVVATALPAGAQTTQPVTIGGSFGFDTPQIQVANSMSLWKAAGVELKPVTFASGRAAFEALLGGQVDFVLAAELPAVTGAMRSQPFAVIADLSRYTVNRIVTTLPVTSIAGLSGQKIGTTIGTSSNFLLDTALSRAGVKAEIVNAAPSDLVPALLRGDIAGASMFSDFFPQAKKVLGTRYHEVRIAEPTHMLLLATRDVIAKRPDAVRGVLRSLLRADQVIKSSPGAVQEIIAASTQGQVSVADLKTVWSQYDYETRLDQSLVDLMTEEGKWVAAGGMIKNVTPDKALFRTYIDAAPLKLLDAGRVSVK